MDKTVSPDGDVSSDTELLQDILQRSTIMEQNQRDILFLLRALRHSLHNVRSEISPATRRIHREVIRMPPFNGRCPCCLDTEVVSRNGQLISPAEFDHFWGPVYSAPVHSWLICQRCHQDLTNDPHLTWYHRLTTRFRRYQAAADAYTIAFGNRTPGRIYTKSRK
jgi:hypothetical protein